jgi:hypothetical protein
MKKLILAGIAIAVLTTGIVQLLVAQPRPAAVSTTRSADLAAKQQAMIIAAQSALAGFNAEESKLLANEVYIWSSRVRSAQAGAAESRTQVTRACQEHLKRMQDLHRRVASLNREGVPGGEAHKLAAAEFYVAEAEVLLLEAKGSENVQPAPRPE